MARLICLLLVCFMSFKLSAEEMPKPLPSEKAFPFNSYIKKDHLYLEWHMPPGYFLYKEELHITVSPSSQVKIKKVIFPLAHIKKDKLGGHIPVYWGNLKIDIPLVAPIKGNLEVEAAYQGCSDQGFCYPPEKRKIHMATSEAEIAQAKLGQSAVSVTSQTVSSASETAHLFDNKSHFFIILSFLGLGLLLAFTPCVLPMIPILSGIIVGHGKNINMRKAFLLSLAYVLGMAIMYAIAGIIVALLGSRIQTFFQTTWAIVIGSSLFILLALSLFGFYKLELPALLRNRITHLSNRQKSGTYVGVFLMGVLSSLIVSPCVSAPLVGVLTYIAQTGDTLLGGLALLALGFGMGIPLLLIGISAGKLLPKAGVWMILLERLFGLIFLGVAISMLSRIVPGPVTLLLWAALASCAAFFMGVFTASKNNRQTVIRGLGVLLLIYSAVLMIGAVQGNVDPLHPWDRTFRTRVPLNATTILSIEEAKEYLEKAKHEGKAVMIDFYADWCVSCVNMERYVFTQKEVKDALSDMVVLRVNVTENDDIDKAFLSYFKVTAPPTFIFYNVYGQEVPDGRLIGEANAKRFLKHLTKLNLLPT